MDTSIPVAIIKGNGTYLLPLELWLTVFRIGGFGRGNIYHLTLVCRQFRLLAQPFLFDEVIISLNTQIITGGHEGFAQTAPYLRRFEERLEFITSNRIAPGVLFVYVLANGLPLHSGDLEDASNVIDKLFEACPHFPNLRTICNFGTTMTGRMIRQVYRTTQLRSLTVVGCSYHDDVGVLGKELQDLQTKPKLVSFTNSHPLTLLPPVANAPIDWWCPLLSPQTTRFITTTCFPDSTLVVKWLRQGAPKVLLQDLTLSFGLVSPAQICQALAQCPALRMLKFLTESGSDTSVVLTEAIRAMDALLRTNAIPHLHTVEVPRDLALAFVRCRPLKALSIWPSTVVDMTLATSIIEEVTQKCPHFSSFSAELNTFSIPWFTSAIEHPCLEKFTISMTDREGLGEDALKELCQKIQLSNVSPKLSNIRLDWSHLNFTPQCEDRKFDKVLPGLSAFLRGRCPNLIRFIIDTGTVRLDMFATEDDLARRSEFRLRLLRDN